MLDYSTLMLDSINIQIFKYEEFKAVHNREIQTIKRLS